MAAEDSNCSASATSAEVHELVETRLKWREHGLGGQIPMVESLADERIDSLREGHGGSSAGAHLLDDGRLVIWSRHGISLWDSISGALLRQTAVPNEWLSGGSPDSVIVGGQIAVWNVDPYARLDPIIRLFDLGDLRHTGRLVGHRDAVTAVRRLSDTRFL